MKLETCGHRWAITHRQKVKRLAKKWKLKEAEAFRKIIEAAK